MLKHIVAIRVYVATAQQLHRLPERHAGVGQLHAQVVDRPLSYFNTLRRGLLDGGEGDKDCCVQGLKTKIG